VPRRPFVVEEEALLISLVEGETFEGWDAVSQHFQGRTARQCRERWVNYLSPDLRTQAWTDREDETLATLVRYHGHRWSTISGLLSGRSENDVKNRWHWHISRYASEDYESVRFKEKRRRHPRVAARENALRLLEEFPSNERASPAGVERPWEDQFDDFCGDGEVNLFML
jgi:hypothetical protein